MSNIVTLFVLISFLFSACTTPIPEDVRETTSNTDVSTPKPSHTPYPTSTLSVTKTAIPITLRTITFTPKVEVDSKATEQAIDVNKEHFSKSTLEMFEDVMGCVLANWEEDSFDLVCVDVPDIYSDDKLTELAFTLTHGLGNQMPSLGLDIFFVEDFKFIVTLMTKDQNTAVRTVTPGNVIKMLLDNEISTQSEWEALSEVDLKEP